MVAITKTRLLILRFSMAASDLKPKEFNRTLAIDFIADLIRRRVIAWLGRDEIIGWSILEVV